MTSGGIIPRSGAGSKLFNGTPQHYMRVAYYGTTNGRQTSERQTRIGS